MTGAFVILMFTALVGLMLWAFDRRRKAAPSEHSENSDSEPVSTECCGKHLVCEKLSLTPLGDEPEYFDDEELDVYKGRAAESYSPEESEQFRDVLLTLPPDEIPAWARSLQLRGITLPPDVRDELLLIASELRFNNT